MKEKLEVLKEYILTFIKEKRSYCIIGAIAILAILAIIFIFAITSKDVENYSGNLINGGFAVNSGKWTYYIKQDGIYKVNSKGDKVDEVYKGIVSYLNSDGKYLYFVENSEEGYNIAKMRKNGEDKQNIIENIDNKMITVADGWIYYLQDESLYKIKIDGKNRIKLLSEDIVSYQIEDNNIYYTYKNGIDCVIARMKTNGTGIVELDNSCNPNFYVEKDKIYYIKEKYSAEKYEYEYTLCQMQTDGEAKQEIVKLPDTLKQINMAEDGVYYLTTEDYVGYELYRVNYNGENQVKLAETAINTKINVIDKNVYYMDLINYNETTVYKINIKNAEKQVL